LDPVVTIAAILAHSFTTFTPRIDEPRITTAPTSPINHAVSALPNAGRGTTVFLNITVMRAQCPISRTSRARRIASKPVPSRDTGRPSHFRAGMAGLNPFTSRHPEDLMKIRTVLPAVAFALVFAGAPALASAPRTDTLHPTNPDTCIERNHGDWNACNVGNSGRGDRPYKPATRYTPNECIKRNHGDWNACNVGNSGRGDRPYKPASR
jgi:hypothetical protein